MERAIITYEGKEYVEVGDGQYYISEDATVIEKRDGTFQYAKEYKINGYRAVIRQIRDETRPTARYKNKIHYVHRMYAEAFIPNPEGKKYVSFRSESKKQDIKIENLCWSNSSEIRKKSARRKEKYTCSICKNPNLLRTQPFVCRKCKAKEERRRKENEELKNIDRTKLTERQREAVERKMSGQNVYEIANSMNCSRQNVTHLIKEAKERTRR